MSRRNLKTFWTLIVAAGTLLIVEHTTLPTVQEFLATTRSEVRSEDLRSLLDGIERVRAEAKPTAADPSRTNVPDETQSAAGDPAADPTDPEDEPSIWRRVLNSIRAFGRMFVRTANLSQSTETPDENSAAAATIDVFNHDAVASDPVLPHTGEMTFRQPIVRIPGTGVDFTFQLSYRSNFQYDGPVGNRWEHNWNARFKDSGQSGDGERDQI